MNKRLYTPGQVVGRILTYAAVLLVLAFTSLPLIYVFCSAFKPLDELVRFPPLFFFIRPTLNNFADLVTSLGGGDVPFLRYVFNSVFTAVITVVLTILVCSMGAYGLIKHRVPFAKFWSLVIIGALMFSTQVTQISTYMVVESLGMVNQYSSLIVPKIAVAFNFFLMQQFIGQLPDAYLEAARIDGASERKIFFSIVFPFLRPAWATLTVFSFTANWNDYFSPLIYITDEAKKTLPLALQSINATETVARLGATAAATLLMTMPTVIIFTLMQKNVIQTMSHSGIKA